MSLTSIFRRRSVREEKVLVIDYHTRSGFWISHVFDVIFLVIISDMQISLRWLPLANENVIISSGTFMIAC